MCLKNQNDLDHPYLESAIALSDRLYTKVEVSINAIATETAVYNALLPCILVTKKRFIIILAPQKYTMKGSLMTTEFTISETRCKKEL